jgi:hypothetical protein
MKGLLNLLAVAAFALPLNLVFADHHKGHEGCCDQKDCCKDCKQKGSKHACCDDKKMAKDCCKNCKDEKCKKNCESGSCKKGHCDLKKPADKKPPQSKIEDGV